MNIQNAANVLADIKGAAVDAGIYQNWFIFFGTLLGAVRPSMRHLGEETYFANGIIEHDDDIDIGVFSEGITKKQEDRYLEELDKRKLFRVREKHQVRKDNGRHLWCTLRRETPPIGTKCCHWFFFEHNGLMWHSKGRSWLNEAKFPPRKYPHTSEDDAIAKGIPAKYLPRGKLVEVEFEGGTYNVPVLAGHCVDYLYPGWMVPRKGGASKAQYIMKIGSWKDRNTWKIF